MNITEIKNSHVCALLDNGREFLQLWEKGLFKPLNCGATKVLKEMGVPIEMEVNSRKPRYNCF